jgi:hypothetical protein
LWDFCRIVGLGECVSAIRKNRTAFTDETDPFDTSYYHEMVSPALDQRVQNGIFRRVESLTRLSCAAWRHTPSTLSIKGKRYGSREKANNDARLENLLVELKAGRLPNAYALKDGAHAAIRSRVRSFLFGLEIPYEDHLQSHERSFSRLTEDFVRDARAFDPGISDGFIGQALRNLWIFASLQVLLSDSSGLTPAGMAYSLLYPYTDNYLDDMRVTSYDKKSFVDRLNQKLRGIWLEPSSGLEEKVFTLVDIIGREFPRNRYRGVHESLLAIHQAQTGSICQQRPGEAGEEEILPLTMRKGGTSVLADAYLAKGELPSVEFGFAFQYGVVLQLIDDFQDVRDDIARQSRTLFTNVLKQPEMEQRCTKVFHLVSRLVESDAFRNLHEGESFRRIIEAGCRMLLFEGIASNLTAFRDGYIDSIEQFCPVSFSALGRIKSRLTD